MRWRPGSGLALARETDSAFPVFILGGTVLPALLAEFGAALVLLPPVHLFFAAAFLVLLGLPISTSCARRTSNSTRS